MNDFDEAALAPCTWEITRLATSVLVGEKSIGIESAEALALVIHLLDAYRDALLVGKALWVERDVSSGLVQGLMDKVSTRKREDLLKKYAVNSANEFEVGDSENPAKHVLPLTPGQRKIAKELFEQFVKQEHPDDEIQLLDVAYRIAGTGSLGISRYILLVQQEKKLRLLDVKQSRPSSLIPHLSIPQPDWASEAQRIVTIQSRLQAISPALLTPLILDEQSYVLRELQPSEDKVDFKDDGVSFKQQAGAIQSMAAIAAWDHLRSSGQQGSATVDELVVFAQDPSWKMQICNYARDYSQQVEEHWSEWKQTWQE